jgi:3',5'-cyclic AMP phosphodiesterase CpdA
MAKRYVALLEKEGFQVFLIPGNHDHYTRRSYRKKSFYRHFPDRFDPDCPYNLKDHMVTYTKLKEGLWLMAIDTAKATSLTFSGGEFSEEIEKNLLSALSKIPSGDRVILMNHFPFFCNDPLHKQLIGKERLKTLLEKHPQVLLYVHGHTHRQTVADLRGSDLPVISDSGCTSHKKNGACHLFNLSDNTVHLGVYRYSSEWNQTEMHTFPYDQALV